MTIRVSIIIPCFNEEKTIFQLLKGLVDQNFPLNQIEVVIADGQSTDKTREEIERFKKTHDQFPIILVENPEKTIPSALNRAIETAQGKYIVRLDAHSKPDKEYVKNSIAGLEKKLGDNIGGVWRIRPGSNTWIAHSIAVAASHKLGVGNALYRYTTKADYVDTVPFGAFRKTLFERIGKFDETLLTNEDYEFNTRIRNSGGRVYLDPSIKTDYFSRPTLGALAKQYWRYGFWKLKMLRKFPTTVRSRQLLPPMFILSLIISGLISIWFEPFRWLLAGEILLYLLTLCLASIRASIKENDLRLLIGIPLAIATMHISWGTGFLFSLFSR